MWGGSPPSLSQVQRLLAGLLLVAVTIPIYPAVVLGDRGMTPFVAVSGALVAVGFFRFLLLDARIADNWITRSAAAFWVVATLSAGNLLLASGGIEDAANFLTVWLQLTLLVALVVVGSTVRFRTRDIRRLVDVYLAVAAAVSVFALYQALARLYGWPLAYLEIMNPSLAQNAESLTRGGSFAGFIRPAAFFTEPSRLGTFLMTPLFLGVFLYRYERPSIRRRVMFLASACIAAGWLVAFSMQAYVAVAIALLVGLVSWSVQRTTWRLLGYGAMALVLVSVSFLFVVDESLVELAVTRALAIVDQFVDIGQYGTGGVENRWDRASAALAVWREHPVFGVGLNAWPDLFPIGVAPRIHGGFVQALTEMGPIGVVALAALSFGSAGILLRNLRVSGDLGWRAALVGALGLGLVARSARILIASSYLGNFFWLDLFLAVVVIGWLRDDPRLKQETLREPSGA